ncbi:hypothetical protein [Microbacterium azadirachtae]|uniref:hypothetical protein n=1 Tax=Microbacterium azadirachtae TaxID=582680 RepID=UPI000B8A3D20|nr:hypothetical protein [Microbacterium azadirachtae]
MSDEPEPEGAQDHEERSESPGGRVDSDGGLVVLRGQPAAFRMPGGFTKSLFPSGFSAVDLIAPINARLQEQLGSLISPMTERMINQMTAALPTASLLKSSAIRSPIFEPLSSQFSVMPKPWVTNLPTLNLVSPATTSILNSIGERYTKIVEGLHASIGPLIDPNVVQSLRLSLLPPNLRSVADEIGFTDVHEFIEQEGIPLYLVPRGRTAVRLLRAKDRAARRRVLGECFATLMDDCEAVLTNVTHTGLREEVAFALDGLGAMRAGHTRSAQAMFTVTLDTLIYGFYPDRNERKALTNRKKDADVPESFNDMGVHEAMVWLPIWNAHEQFWKDKGDEIPRHYSRHASVHGVSSRQFSKRNCVQVLMLVTSLIGHAERVMGERSGAR